MGLNNLLQTLGHVWWQAALVGVLGLVLVAVALAYIIPRARRGVLWRSSGTYIMLPLLLLGWGATGLVTAALVKYPQGVQRLFEEEFTDPARVQKLAQADLGAVPPTAVLPGAWPQWRGPRRDGVSTETGLLDAWPAGGPPVVWRQPLKGGYSSIAVVDGRLYTMDRDDGRERVVCFDAATGRELWAYAYDFDFRAMEGGNKYGAGPRATPTVYDGRVYTVGATGDFLCLEAAPQGNAPRLLWRHDLRREFDADVPDWGFACSPLIEGDLVIVQPGAEV